MSIRHSAAIALVLSVVGSSIASAAAITGTLTTSDQRFNRPSSATGLSSNTSVAYDTYTVTADAAGPYSIQGNFPAPLDGYLLIYSSFNPSTPLAGLLAADDDEVLNGAAGARGASIPGGSNYGPATNGTVLTLTPGTSYTLVVSAFSNYTSTSGLGSYTVTLNNISVPEPTTLAGLGVGAVAFGARRRRG